MTDWPLVAVRFALYADLGLAFGWPLFCLYALRGEERRGGGHLPTALPLILFGLGGVVLSALGLGLMAAAMGGTGLSDVDPAVLDILLHGTSVGTAFLVRMAALALVAVAGLLAMRTPVAGLSLAAAAGAVALASLAWNGHAAATEGRLAAVHLGSDFLHLWAAGLWLGALFALVTLVAPRDAEPARIRLAHRVLEGFSRIGTAAVLVLVLTGIVNGAIILGTFAPSALIATAYGQLLVIKIALFGLMLALAGANRFRLTPSLGTALRGNETPARAAARLRLSLGLETAAALIILALVGWLGTLEPSTAS